jgi:hypothetical protein
VGEEHQGSLVIGTVLYESICEETNKQKGGPDHYADLLSKANKRYKKLPSPCQLKVSSFEETKRSVARLSKPMAKDMSNLLEDYIKSVVESFLSVLAEQECLINKLIIPMFSASTLLFLPLLSRSSRSVGDIQIPHIQL